MILAILFLLQALPPAFAPGAINPAVTQGTLQQTVCAIGWTKTQRPSRYWSAAKKAELLHRAHMPLSARPLFELDHRVPLELGGHPTDARNLWLQPREHPGADEKDHLENLVHYRLCHGRMTLREAQQVFLGDWFAAYKTMIGERRQ